MYVAGDLESNAELIENVVMVMEAARLGACRSRGEEDPPIRLGSIELKGPSFRTEPEEPASDGPRR